MSIYRCFLLLLLANFALCLGTSYANSQTTTNERATPPLTTPIPLTSMTHFSETGLAALDRRLQQLVSDGHVIGISALLMQSDQVAYRSNYGMANPSSGTPVSSDTIFRIYSMTKPVTAAALMRLYEDGLWKMDDPISKFIPELADLRVIDHMDSGRMFLVPSQREPTIRDLLTHTAGFAYGLHSRDPVNRMYAQADLLQSRDSQRFIDTLSRLPLRHQPGETWEYSVASDIQGVLIERLTGKPLGEVMHEVIFEPLGMIDTGFFVPEDKRHRFSAVFGNPPYVQELIELEGRSYTFGEETIGMPLGGGGLVSTIDDFAAFCQMMQNNGRHNGRQILAPETVRAMLSPALPDDMPMWAEESRNHRGAPGLTYGLGVGIISNARASGYAFTDGSWFWDGMAGTWFWVDPARDLFFIGMIQRIPAPGAREIDFPGISSHYVYRALEPKS